MDYTDLEPSATLTGTGSEMILVLEPKSFKPFKSKDEYMYAMKEDLADWFTCLYSSCITVDNFFEVLETGVELCKHANSVRKFALEQQEQVGTKPQLTRHIPNGEIQYRKDVKAQTFHARDNVSNFISWCRDIGVPEVLRFETDDLVLRKNERSVVLCLLEVARVGAKLGMLAPTIVQMEEEIDAELAGEPPPPMKQIITCDLKSLDEMVRELVGKCTCPSQFPIIKVGEGKYKIGDSQTLIFVRILRNHVMVRVGGGWDTLENYLDKHDPCRCHFKGHRGNTSNQSAAIKRATVRRASAPSGQILADHINQRSPKKDSLSTAGGKYIAATPPRCESPVSGRSSKRSSGQTSQYSSSENLHRTPCQSPAKHSKMLPPATVGGKTQTSPAKRAASPASTSSLPSSSHRSSASSSLSASSEKLNSSESRSSGGKLDMDQISTMTLEQFKNLLNNQLITTAREQTAADSSETPPSPSRQKGKVATSSSSNKLQNPSTKNILPPNSQGRGSKQNPAVRSADHSPDITRRTQSPSPSLAGLTREASDREGFGDGVKPRGKKPGLSFLPGPSTQPAVQSNGESKIPMKKRPGATTAAQITRQATVPPCEVRTQRSLPSTPKQERRYNRTLAPHKSMDNTTKQISSIAKRAAIVQRATMQAPKLQPQSKIETRRSSTPGLRELQVYSESGNANFTDDTQSSADEENEGLKTPTPTRRLMPNSQSGLPYRSSSTQSLSLAVKGDIEIEEPPRPTSHPTGYVERWRRSKRSTSAIRSNAASSSPDTITVSRTQSGGHSVVLGKGPELGAGFTSTGQETSRRDPSRDTYEAAVRRARSITRNSRIARSQSADRFSYRQRSSSTSSVEDNDQTYVPKDSEQKRRLTELANKFYNSERCSGLRYDRNMRFRRGGSVTPNSIDIYDCDLSSRPLEEIKAALNPVSGIVPQVSDPNELEAPPEDPETYEKMEKLFEAYRQKELRDMVEATDRNKEDQLDPDNGDIDSRGNNTDASSLDSNANLPTSGQSSETGSRRSSFHKTSDTESIDKAISFKDRRKIPGISSKSGSSRIPTSHIPSLSCRIPTPKSKISSRSGISGGIPKSSFSYQKNGVKSYRNYDDDDDDDNDDNNSASATSDNHELLSIEPNSDASRRTSYSDESIISTSDASVNNIGLRPEAQVPRVAQPLTTGRQRLISSRRNDIESRAEKTKLVRPLAERSARDTNSSEQKLFHDEDEETY